MNMATYVWNSRIEWHIQTKICCMSWHQTKIHINLNENNQSTHNKKRKRNENENGNEN